MDQKGTKPSSNSRREFIKKAAYIPPVIATMSIAPAVYASGSGYRQYGSRDGRYGSYGSRDGRYGSRYGRYRSRDGRYGS